MDKQLLGTTATLVSLFIFLAVLNLPTMLFGLADFVQSQMGYFFGIVTQKMDYFLLFMLPVLGYWLTALPKRTKWLEIFKTTSILFCCCAVVFVIGTLLLLTDIGSPRANALIPQILRVVPYKYYATFLLGVGLFFSVVYCFKRKAVQY